MGKEDKRRYFPREFKVNAVQPVTEKGMPVGKVAQELDIHPNLLHLLLQNRTGLSHACR